MNRDLALALGYRPGIDRAPRLLARGEGAWAQRVVELAERHGVPVREDDELARLLAPLPLESEIPPELYPAVAEILAFLYAVARECVTPADHGEVP